MKPKQKKPPAKKSASKSNTRLLLVVFTLMTIAIINLVVIRTSNSSAEKQRQLAADKASFALVEAEMAKAYEGMLQATRKPDESQVYKTCSRISQKYKEGQLRCGITYEYKYQVSSYQDAVGVAKRSLNNLSSSTFEEIQSSNGINRLDSLDSRNLNGQTSFIEKNGIPCSLSFTFSESKANLFFKCNKSVASPVYALAE